jgi:hypothetical protein
MVVSSLSQLKTVDVGGKLYSVDPSIYAAVVASLKAKPVGTPCELSERIADIRETLNVAAPLSVQLAKVGLNNYTKRYTYLTAGRSQQSTKQTANEPIKYGTPLKTGMFIKDYITWGIRLQRYVPLSETLQWKESIPEFYEYLYLFPGKTFSFDKARFIYVVLNSACSYTADAKELFPGGKASVFGIKLLSRLSLVNYFSTRLQDFRPFPCTVTPVSNPGHYGVLLSKTGLIVSMIRGEIESEVIFLPAESNLDRIQNIEWDVDVGVTVTPI